MENEQINQSERDAKAERFGKSLGMPAKFGIEHFKKAMKVLADLSGKAQVKQLNAAFGQSSYERELHGRALKFAEELGFAKREGNSYTLTQEGRNFIAANEDARKADLKQRLLAYGNYREIFVALKNAKEKSMKKEDMNNLWVSLAGGGAGIRKYISTTFASLCDWVGIVKDTGKTCVFIDDSSAPLPNTTESLTIIPITKKEQESPVTSTLTNTSNQTLSLVSANLVCPRCRSANVALVDEKVIESFKSAEKLIVVKQLTHNCNTCQREFTRTSKENIS